MTTIPAECLYPTPAVLGEGPVWDAVRQCLWWVDIEQCQLHCFQPSSKDNRTWAFQEPIGFAVPTVRGDLIMGAGPTLVRWAPETEELTPLVEAEARGAGTRFNDAKCDSQGRLWAGTMAVSGASEFGSLYRLDADRQLGRVVTRVSISNGLAWSRDGGTLYYVDSPTRRVDAFDVDPATGTVANRRPVIEITEGFPDGMCIDEAGNLWIALWGGWGIGCFDPRTGKQLAKIAVPVECVTSCCFGGPGWSELYITTSRRDLDAAGREREPLAGSLFIARPGIRGWPTELFGG